MCWFIEIGAPSEVELDERRLAVRGGRVQRAPGSPLQGALPAGDVAWSVSAGGCACGLFAQADFAEAEARARRAYTRRGWSAAKIERAVEARREDGRLGEPAGHRAFREFFAEVARSAGRVRLLVHDASDAADAPRATVTLSLAEYEQRLGQVPVGAIVVVERRA